MGNERKPGFGLLGAGLAYLARLAEQPEKPTMTPDSSSNVITNSPPYIVTIHGHFSAGKDAFKDELRAQMAARGKPVIYLRNYKGRDPRGREIPGVDYDRIDSPQHYDQLKRDRKILVPYTHDERQYGLPNFMGPLSSEKIPLMVTDEAGLVALMEYLSLNSVPNRLISFLLHTNKNDALARLHDRSGRPPTQDEVRQIQAHLRGYVNEIERYKAHEDLFRHVLRNDTIEGVPKEARLHHLGLRAISILDLEERIIAPTPVDFREAYVNEAVRRLFGASTQDLVGSVGQGIQLPISDEAIRAYAHEHGIDLGFVRAATKKKILNIAPHYGYLSLYLEPTTTDAEKRVLTDLIERAMNLPHQFKRDKQAFTSDSALSLQKVADVGYIDFLISFSSYDPMRTPRPDSRVHTLVFQSIKDNRSPRIEHIPIEEAKKIVEGNGT